MSAPAPILHAVSSLWQEPRPSPDNLLSAPLFVRLLKSCESVYPNTGRGADLSFALSNALRALGLPSGLTAGNKDLALSAEDAATQLDTAFRRTELERIHLCPLDMADTDTLPFLSFGPNTIRTFTEGDLNAIVCPARLKRINSSWSFDAKRFSEFSWLVVKERAQLTEPPGTRAVPMFSSIIDLNQDFGRIEPHYERFPTAVMAALFVILLVPWEDWTNHREIDWRAFHVPWVYTLDDDIFARPSPPPSPDTLTWGPKFFTDWDGETIEVEAPVELDLDDAATGAASLLNDTTWAELSRARQSPLFETPIAHFLVTAFLTEDMDAFLAHITTIEAALGLQSDYGPPPRGTRQPKLRSTARVATRVAGLLGTKLAGEDYRDLFDIRSEFLHGRRMSAISSKHRNLARGLARKVVSALVAAALTQPAVQSRETFLETLVDVGVSLR